MGPVRPFQSVVSRLTVCLLLGGVTISLALAVIESRRSASLLQQRLTHQVARTVDNLAKVASALDAAGRLGDMPHLLAVLAPDASILAAKIESRTGEQLYFGDFPARLEASTRLWQLHDHSVISGQEVDLHRPTLVRSVYGSGTGRRSLELVIDGDHARRQMVGAIVYGVAIQWVIVGLLTLVGLLLFRYLLIGPLSRLVTLAGSHTGAEPFYAISRSKHDEFGQLAAAIGGMLCRIENTSEQLRGRQQAFEHLYEWAPAAMLSIDQQHQITQANQRAADLFEQPCTGKLIGRAVFDLIEGQDHHLLHQAMDRLSADRQTQCELRATVDDEPLTLHVQCLKAPNDQGGRSALRLSFVDVSRIKMLQHEVGEKNRLLDLVINHMSDAILLVDRRGRVAAFNEQLLRLIGQRRESLANMVYEPRSFWDNLGVLDSDDFVQRLLQIQQDTHGPAQYPVNTRIGSFLFQSVAVADQAGQGMGRLWIVQDVTAQAQSKRLLEQQAEQLQAVRRLSFELAGASGIDELMTRAADLLYDIFKVDTVGMALRDGNRASRALQLIHRGRSHDLLEANRRVVEAVQCQLMPRILESQQSTYWPDLAGKLDWEAPFVQAGMTALAGISLQSSFDTQGMLWIAQRSGNPLGRQQINLLEAVAPMLAARIEFAHLRHDLHRLEQTDQSTDLPNEDWFIRELRQMEAMPQAVWSVIVIEHEWCGAGATSDDHAPIEIARQIGALLRRHCRRSNIIARLDTCRYGVLCPDMSRDQALGIAERLIDALNRLAGAEETSITIEFSPPCMGVAAYPQDGQTAPRVLVTAVSHCQQAQAEGGGIICSDPEAAELKQAG